MDVKNLDDWYSSKEYDLENKEFNRILKLGKIKKRKVLIIGSYGALAIAHKIVKYATSTIVVHDNKKITAYCRKHKSKKIQFKHYKIESLPFPVASFDTILFLWAGLHYQSTILLILKELSRILKEQGILLIEEADETSEYVKILNLINSFKKTKIKKYRNNLKIILQKYFDVKENKLNTSYQFKNKTKLNNYFKQEIILQKNARFTKNVKHKLEGYLVNKRTLKIKEKSYFFVCSKKQK